MKMNIRLSPGTLIEVIGKDGNVKKYFTNDEISAITLEPFFSTATTVAETFTGTVKTNNGHVVDRFSVLVSGKNGKTFFRRRGDRSAVPKVDSSAPTPPEPAKTE